MEIIKALDSEIAMPSKQAQLLNFLLRRMLKPVIRHYLDKYMKTQDITIIYRFRNIINYFPHFASIRTTTVRSTINGVSVIEVLPRGNIHSTLIYLHGGGYLLGISPIYMNLAQRLAITCSAKILLVDYSLAPEKKFPTALNEVIRVYESTLLNTSVPLFMAGDSSGGGLTLSVLVALRDKQIPLPKAAICISPWTDLAFTGESLHTNQLNDSILSIPLYQFYVAEKDKYHPYASPLYADLHGLPPLLIQVSDTEILLDDARRFHKKAIAARVNATLEIWNDLPHVWHLFAGFLPEGIQAIKKFANIILQENEL